MWYHTIDHTPGETRGQEKASAAPQTISMGSPLTCEERLVSLLRLSLLRFRRLETSGKFPLGLRIPPLEIKILLESNPLKSRILVRGLAIRPISLFWQLPDGVRTNGVVAEVPQFSLMNFHGNMWAKCGEIWQHVATYNMAKCGTQTSSMNITLQRNKHKHVFERALRMLSSSGAGCLGIVQYSSGLRHFFSHVCELFIGPADCNHCNRNHILFQTMC